MSNPYRGGIFFLGFGSKEWELLHVKHSAVEQSLEGIENKQRLQTLSIDNAWSNKKFFY